MKLRTLLIIVAAVLTASLVAAVAQVTNTPPPAPGLLPASTWQDIVKVFQDFGINIGWVGTFLTKYYVPLGFAARLFRKYAPAKWQNGKIATACSHVGLELVQQAQAAKV